MIKNSNRLSSRRKQRPSSPPKIKGRNSYRQLRHPFDPQSLWSDDRVEAVHETALRILKELGIKILLPEARRILAKAGAHVDEDSQLVWIGQEIVLEALRTAPKSYSHARNEPQT